MSTLIFAAPDLQFLREQLKHSELESGALLSCVPVWLASRRSWRLMVREMYVASECDYEVRTPARVQLKTGFYLPIEKRARVNGWSLVYVHTHPRQAPPTFSGIDDEAEDELSKYLKLRCPGVPHLSLLLGSELLVARQIGTAEKVQVIELGGDVRIAYNPSEPILLENRFDRQVRAFGTEGQDRISKLTVAIVGLGGTGSHVLQQLAHLGVKNFVLVEPDIVEATNLNRVVGARLSDVGKPKIEYAKRLLRSLDVSRPVVIRSDVSLEVVARRVVEADVVFNCTDTQASRHVLNQAAYQYMVPVFDMGTSITVDDNMHAQLAGHSKMLSPSLPCLWCANHIDAEQLRRELMIEEQRQADPYVRGVEGVKQPAVVSLNGVVASLSVTMMLSAVAGIPSPSRYVHYDGNRSRVNGVAVERNPNCVFCGSKSTAGYGDTYPLPGKKNG